MPVYLIATLDTKGVEAAFLQEQLQHCGVTVRLVDVGCLGDAPVPADLTRSEVFSAAEASLPEVQTRRDRGAAVRLAA